MRRVPRFFFLAVLVFGALLSVGCAKETNSDKEVRVAAAASLTDVLQELGERYEATHPGVKVSFNFGASGALSQAIEHGGAADVFFSAGKREMDRLETAGEVASRQDLLQNELVLIVPKGAKKPVDWSALTDSVFSRIAMGETQGVPVGAYAKEMLLHIGLWDSIEKKAVFASDVRQVLAWVEMGEAQAGIVYATDAAVSNRVNTALQAPAGSHEPIIYPVAVLKGAKDQKAAQSFVEFLESEEAAEIFSRYGFAVR